MVSVLPLLIALTLSAPADLADQARQLEAKKQWSEAAQTWQRLAASNPTSPRYPLNAANDFYEAQAFESAIAAYTAADELGVSYRWDMPYSIACCYCRLGKKADALAWLTKAINLGYRDLKQVQI